MDSVKSQLEMLHENNAQKPSNYVSWKFKLNLALKSKSLYEIANGVKIKPEGANTDTNVANWIKLDLEAQTLIGLNVSSNVATKIANCTSSSQMIKNLKLFMERNLLQLLKV